MKIVLIGAYGYTGRLICALLQKENMAFDICGRKIELLTQLKVETPIIEKAFPIDISQSNSFQLIEKYDCIINSAGPFTEESAELTNHIASQSNKIYLDISGEVGFINTSYLNNHEVAKEHDTCLIHACAFESMIAGLAFQLHSKGKNNYNSIKTLYQFSKSRPSPGTRITMKMSKFREIKQVDKGEWNRYVTNSFVFNEELSAVPYPMPEMSFFHWMKLSKQISSHLLLPKEEAIFVRPQTAPKEDARKELEILRKRKNDGPITEDRLKQECTIYIETLDENNTKSTTRISGKDMYQVTAECILLAIKKISSSNQDYGVINPADLFKNKEENILKKLGFTLTFDE